jgi:hypothetical protein
VTVGDDNASILELTEIVDSGVSHEWENPLDEREQQRAPASPPC